MLNIDVFIHDTYFIIDYRLIVATIALAVVLLVGAIVGVRLLAR